jgi:histidine triad (HIT) family protein
MQDCLFCRVVRKSIPASIVHETDTVLAFRDIRPVAPVHVLVIPKEHVSSIMAWEARHASLIEQVHSAIRKVAAQENVDRTGFRVVVNNGANAGQAVGHVHYHVLGGRPLQWPPG